MSAPVREVDPLLKDLNEKKQSFRRSVVSLAAELKELRSRLASQEQSVAKESVTRQEAESKLKNMEKEISRLEKSLEERTVQLQASNSAAEMVIRMSTTRFETEKFSGKNDFGLWRIKMRALLVQQGLSEAIKEPEEGSKAEDLKNWEEKQEKAHSALILSLGDKVLREVAHEKTASAVWKKLESLYMEKSLANRLYMKQKLYAYRITDEKSVVDQLEEFNKAVDDLENIGVKIEDEDKAIILLNALPRSFEHLKDAMLYGRTASISVDEVQSALKAKEMQKQNEEKMGSNAEGLNIKQKNQRNFKSKKNSGQTQKKNFQKKGKDQAGKEDKKCFHCNKPGHFKKECFGWLKLQAQKDNRKNEADVAEGDIEPEVLNITDTPIQDVWIMDSGCSFHMTPHKEWFIKLEKVEMGAVLLGNDQSCNVQGIGDIKLLMTDGSIKILEHVRYIPKLKRNLLSLGLLESKGYSFNSRDGFLYVYKNEHLFMKGVRRNSLYYLQAKTVTGNSGMITEIGSRTWHERLAHISQRGLDELSRQGKISLAGNDRIETCEECILGKSKKQPYKASTGCSSEILDYAHADLWGPSRVETLGGGRYFMSIMDDFSRKLWIYVLKHKTEALKKFREWHVEAENSKGKKLKCLRTDNGLEFMSEEFSNFCKDKGIKRHKTVPGNPQQNGVIERMNRTILERVRCMLTSSGLSKGFWGEAASTAAYLINRSPTTAKNFNTPEELWTVKATDYKNLKVFGCLAYAHVRQDKLDPRALKCVFLGYPEGTKGFRLWCFESGKKKIIISRDVIFDESRMPFLEKETQQVSVEQSQWENEKAKVEYDEERDISHQNSGNQHSTHSRGTEIQADRDLSNYQLARDRERRRIQPPKRYGQADMIHYALNIAEETDLDDPRDFQEAMRSKDSKQWHIAMQEEMDSLRRNNTWVLVDKPKDQRLISSKWIFKRKIENTSQKSIRYKARLVARGFSQREGVDFNEVFSPVVKHTSIRILLALVVQYDLILEQLDVKTAFLHGDLEETLFMSQPEGFVVSENKNKVCKLQKSLYGLRQSPRQWYKKFDEHMLRIGFSRSEHDSCVYIKRIKDVPVAFLLLYVDDMLVASKSQSEINSLKQDLKHQFDMKELGKASRILGIDIIRNSKNKSMILSQADYIRKVLIRFNMNESKEVSVPLAVGCKLSSEQQPKTDDERQQMDRIPYANAVGSVMYTMICTRPDIAHAVSVVSRYMANPGIAHWEALKKLLRYLKGASDMGLEFKQVSESSDKDPLQGFVDSDYASNEDNRRSQTGFVFTLFGTAICWKSTLQHVVALSTTEAEYMALTECVKEALWLKGLLSEFGIRQDSVNILCDSQSAISLAKNQVFHERTKHIDVRLHFIRDEVNNGSVKILKVHTDHNAADMLTKPVPLSKFKHCLGLMGFCSVQ